MQVKEFHTRLTHLMPKLDAVLAAGRDFAYLPTFDGRSYGGSSCTPSFMLGQIKPLMDDPGWPRAGSPAVIIKFNGVDVGFTNPVHYVMRPYVAMVVNINNTGKFVLYVSLHDGEYHLTGWSYLPEVGVDFTYFYLGLPEEEGQSEGPLEFLERAQDFVYNRVEHIIHQLAADPEIAKVGLNCTNANGLYNFASKDGWALLPWISNNQYMIPRPADHRIEHKLGWEQHGPFDTFGLTVSVEGEPLPRVYTVVILNRTQVVECYGGAKGQPANALQTAGQMVPFWVALQRLVDDAKWQLRTSL